MSLDRFELLELRRDDGIQTYHAREILTARPVQVHLFAEGPTRDVLALLAKLAYLPEDERRRVIDRGMFNGKPYMVTDRLAGFASLREWVELKCIPSVDEQFARLFDPVPQRSFSEPAAPEPRRPAPGSSFLALFLGTFAAILFLALVIAFFVFRPHWL